MKFTVGHIFSGIGGKALGAAAAVATFGNASARFETIGGIDVDMVPPAAAERIAEQLLRALLIAKLGAFALGSSPVWVAPSARAVVA